MSEDTIDPTVVPAAIETTESTPSNETVETTAETSTETKPRSEKPAGYEPIDPHTATPEQTKQRLDYLYSQVKRSERQEREMKGLLEQQSRIINELSEGQKAVVGHLTQKSFADGKQQLQQQMQEAWKKQDNRAYIEAQNKLMDLQVEERLAARQPQQNPQPQNQRPQNAAEIANRAMQTGEINPEAYRTTETWQNERDDVGNLVRPWAFDSDPRYRAAFLEAQSVMTNPRYENLSYEQKLEEIDRRMGTQKRTVSQSVMGGSLTKPAKSAKLQLTPKQREIALKTQYAGKGKSEQEHLDKYRQQIEKFQQRRAK